MSFEREQLREFARKHKLRHDWHEPDEQGVSARVVGDHLDNAHGNAIRVQAIEQGFQEYVVIIEVEGEVEPLKVNLATLLAIACAEG